MSDEFYDADRMETFGFPWHGLWRQASGDVLSILGTSKPLSLYGLNSGYLPADGDCFVVRHPEAAGAVASVEEAAAGMSWPDYALFSGANRVYAGAELGRRSWVYVAPDGSCWLAYLPIAQFTQVSTGAINTTLTLSPFGRFGEPEDPVPSMQSIQVALAADWFAASHAAFYSDARYYIDDINPLGARVLLTPGAGLGMVELRITGTPPAASAELVVVWTAETAKGTEQTGGSSTTETVGGVLKRVGTGTAIFGEADVLLGGFYMPDGETVEPVVCTSRVERNKTYSWTTEFGGALIVDYSNTQVVNGRIALSAAGRSVEWAFSATETATPATANHLSRTISLPFYPTTISFDGFSGPTSYVTDYDYTDGLTGIVASIYPCQLEFADFVIQPRRLANGVHELVVLDKTMSLWPGAPGNSLWRANTIVLGKLGTGGNFVSRPDGSGVLAYASEQPETGEIAHAAAPVCWI